MAKMRLVFFNVDRGFSCFIRTPTDDRIMMDCGRRENFSPAKYVYDNELTDEERDDKNKITYLTISHPHEDHIGDIENVHKILNPKTLLSHAYDWKEIKELGQEYPAMDYLAKIKKTPFYTLTVKPREYGVKFRSCQLVKEAKEINADPQHFVNNSSILSTVEFGGQKFLFTGDIESEMWEVLLEKTCFQEFIADTNIVVAPHHGLKSSFSSKLYDYISPRINIVSEKSDQTVDTRYSSEEYYSGVKYGEENRKSFTTRGGTIEIEVKDDKSWSLIFVDV